MYWLNQHIDIEKNLPYEHWEGGDQSIQNKHKMPTRKDITQPKNLEI